MNTYPVGTGFGTPSELCLFRSLSTSGWWGGHPVNTYPVETRFGTPPVLCMLCSLGWSSHEHLSGGNPLWYTTCALHA